MDRTQEMELAVWTAAFGAAYAQLAVARLTELGRGHSDVSDPDDPDICRRIADNAVRVFVRNRKEP